jgi:GMP synthase-like glutamine amidotransferase
MYDKLCSRVSEILEREDIDYELIKKNHYELAPYISTRLKGVHRLVFSGSKFNEPDVPEMEDVAKLMQIALEDNLPVFGVCFGFQLMAYLLDNENGMVQKGGASWEDVDVTVIGEDPVLKGVSPVFKARQYHDFSVPYTGPNIGIGKVLAHSRTGVEIIRAGPMVATQYHPEKIIF